MTPDSSGQFTDRFVARAVRFANNLWFRSASRALAASAPFFFAAGAAALVDRLLLPLFLNAELLPAADIWWTGFIRVCLTLAGIIYTAAAAWFIGTGNGVRTPWAGTICTVISLFILFGESGLQEVLSSGRLGTDLYFGCGAAGLIVCSIFHTLHTGFLKLTDKNVLAQILSAVSVLFCCIVLSQFVTGMTGTAPLQLFCILIAIPFGRIITSLAGICVISCLCNLLYCFGLRSTEAAASLVGPFLFANTAANTLAWVTGETAAGIVNLSFVSVYGMIGGAGSTLCLILAYLIFGKSAGSRRIAGASLKRGLFNINEPMIFGVPIIFNMALLVPFSVFPSLAMIAAWFATHFGFISSCTVCIPFQIPPVIGPLLATGGDWRAVLFQLVAIAAGTLFYLPFMRASDKIRPDAG